MVDSSSSSSESELDRNLAHSECDIRTRLHTTATRRRRHHYMTRKSNSNSASSQDKLYGSNASIKSAPQYNYHSDRRQYYNHLQHPPYHYADDFGIRDNDEEDESIYEFGVRHAHLQSEGKLTTTSTHKLPAAAVPAAAVAAASSSMVPAASSPGSASLVSGAKFGGTETPNYTNKALEREYLYSEFDVSKLTGKSPTTQSYFPTGTAAGQGQQPVQKPTVIPATAKTNPSTITEEARIAYNSLVENPCTSGASGGFSNSVGQAGNSNFTCSTLPRAKLTNSLATASFRFKDIDCCSPPSEPAPKSPEEADLLLSEGSMCDNITAECNPLRMMRNKNFSIVPRSKNKISTHQVPWEEQLDTASGSTNQAESPSYLTNPEYTYNNALTSTLTETRTAAEGTDNPIPLPPRDRNKTIPVNQKRHVRKYPLIIPAAGLQRTLNKVTQVTPIDEKSDVFSITDTEEPTTAGNKIHDDHLQNDPDECSNLDVLHKSIESIKLGEIDEALTDLPSNATEQLAQQKGYSKEFLQNNFPSVSANPLPMVCGEQHSSTLSNTITTTTLPATIPAASAILTRRRTASDASVLGASAQRRQPPPPPPPPAPLMLSSIAPESESRDPTYENLDIFQTHNSFCIDTASLHCESILENDANSCTTPLGIGGSTAATDLVDGFEASIVFDSINSSEFHQTRQPIKPPSAENEQHDRTTQPTTEGELKKSMNFVSCEDLLEFAEKPKGRARGLESDEIEVF
uniref:Uncharacterized protein n=1 Tax=Anopheles melas TaxID=34690 RepID=A0A182UC66_9DIPT